MKLKKTYIAFFLFCISYCTFAQKISRIAFVDIDYILENLEEYKVANEQLAEKVKQWQGEFEQKKEEINQRKQQLQAERPLLTPEMVSDKQEEIALLEKNLEVLQQKRFGGEQSDYMRQKWQIAQPIHNQVFNIIQEIGKTKKYDYIFTKEDLTSIYAEDKHDITKIVLRILKRKENAEDRNKDIGTLLKENYDFELKDEKTRKQEERERQRAELIAKNKAEREARQRANKEKQELRKRQKQELLEQRQKEREQQKRNNQKNNNN